jgi:hypothetical protein
LFEKIQRTLKMVGEGEGEGEEEKRKEEEGKWPM